MGEMGYMLCSTGVPVPYRLGESEGRVLDDTVLYAGGTGAICLWRSWRITLMSAVMRVSSLEINNNKYFLDIVAIR